MINITELVRWMMHRFQTSCPTPRDRMQSQVQVVIMLVKNEHMHEVNVEAIRLNPPRQWNDIMYRQEFHPGLQLVVFFRDDYWEELRPIADVLKARTVLGITFTFSLLELLSSSYMSLDIIHSSIESAVHSLYRTINNNIVRNIQENDRYLRAADMAREPSYSVAALGHGIYEIGTAGAGGYGRQYNDRSLELDWENVS